MKTLLLLFYVLCLGKHAQSCSCTEQMDFFNSERTLQWFNYHDVVFSARIDSIVSPPLDKFGMPSYYYEEIYVTTNTVYKGDIPSKVKVSNLDYATSCDFNLHGKEGTTYLFYGFLLKDSSIYSHYCNGSKRLYTLNELDKQKYDQVSSDKQEISLLAEIQKHRNGTMSFRYSNGVSMGKGKLKNGMAEGPWIYYNYYGKETAKGNYYRGKKTGIWEEHQHLYNYNSRFKKTILVGTFFESGTYEKGIRSGTWTEYGHKLAMRTVKNRARSQKILYPQRIGRYTNGQKDGIWITKDENGNITDSTLYQEDIPSETNK